MSDQPQQPNKPSVDVVDTTSTATNSSRIRNRALRRLVRNPLALVGVVVLVVAVLMAVLAPIAAPHGFSTTNFDNLMAPPGSDGHLLGTDNQGRDVLSRIMFGMQASLQVGVLSVLIALAVGVPLGLMAGYFSLIDTVVSRLTDLVLAFPFLILAVGLTAIRGPSLTNAAIAIGVSQMPGMIRVTRSETLRIKSLEYVSSAIAAGAGNTWILARHVLPNAVSSIIVQATVAIPVAILGEAVLSFLGLGLRPPAPSLGVMLSDAQQYAGQAPWAAVIPGVCIVLVALAFNLFGDGLRDALDPKASRQ